ncbi:Hypothetical protein MexAM1_META2p0664 (plasmid) [Methylorubrum extorquens AM1]|uniref:Uncharacterized protein n=1 Tax=Methylorubrum extorquens (strain ATCC 14718 / DSM 1338 / JCM 2805 / NCIMB 9133 / AM1) TaxID=272630 RepID=C5B4X9_METEA|nr:Hypothetical protein MexAM1_META2p0664 [Methylorubrum extorquens AM1]
MYRPRNPSSVIRTDPRRPAKTPKPYPVRCLVNGTSRTRRPTTGGGGTGYVNFALYRWTVLVADAACGSAPKSRSRFTTS